MKRQIALLGGQLVPIYLGILERQPSFVHLIFTEELKRKVLILERYFTNVKFDKHMVDPFNPEEIGSLVENLILDNENDVWEANLTGGTKIMTLATHIVFKDLGIESFYLDQKGRFYFFQEKKFKQVIKELKIETFLKLSGHSNIRKSNMADYDVNEFRIAQNMADILNDSDVEKLFKEISSQEGIADLRSFQIKKSYGEVKWDGLKLQISTKKINHISQHKNAFKICFTGLFWELRVAEVVNKWPKKKEMQIGVELMTNSTSGSTKNEIDIIINTGQKMIFIECKSGNVYQDDINKMRVVKRLYGGISSRAILVCRKLPRKNILEKCEDLGIEVFALKKKNLERKSNRYVPLASINSLNNRLNQIISIPEI